MSVTNSKSSHRRQQIWVCVIAGLFLCDFVVCGWVPSRQRLTSLQQAKAQQKRTIDLATAQGVEISRLKTKLRDTERLVERFDASVPPERTLGGFLQQIQGVMTQCDLTDPAVLPGRELEAGDLGRIPVRITCTGTLTQLFSFFSRLRTLDRLVRVETVMIQNDVGFTGRLSLEAEVTIFYQSARLRTEAVVRPPSTGEGNHDA
jgi:Tfp pilus assembly protein PilO